MQDFTKKMTIALRDDLASWLLTNTIGHIAAYLGNKMGEPFSTGDTYTSQDGLEFPRPSQFPVVALKTSKEQLKELVAKVRDTDLVWIAYVQGMIDEGDDEKLAGILAEVPSENMNILGVGIFGAKDTLKELTGNLKLWK